MAKNTSISTATGAGVISGFGSVDQAGGPAIKIASGGQNVPLGAAVSVPIR